MAAKRSHDSPRSVSNRVRAAASPSSLRPGKTPPTPRRSASRSKSKIKSPSSSDSSQSILLRGVRQNNLKGFDLDIPLNQLVVLTGLSGSGKSSLAFDTLYAEGQRRYIETFSPYARQFLDRMDKPAVDRIENIPPAIAIEQSNTVRTTRSTVGTLTEICDHMKVLWPHISELHCPGCHRIVRRESPEWIWQSLNWPGNPPRSWPENTPLLITFNLPLSSKLKAGEQARLLEQQGFQRILFNNEVLRLAESVPQWKSEPKDLTVVVDRIQWGPTVKSRFIDACEQAYRFGSGRLQIIPLDPRSREPRSDQALAFSADYHCAQCDVEYREPTTSLFSFNHPHGACPHCRGFGRVIEIDPWLALPNRRLSLYQGVVRPWQSGVSSECQRDLLRMACERDVPVSIPFDQMTEEHRRWVMEGDSDYIPDDPEFGWPNRWYGVQGYFRWLESKAYKMHVRVLLSRYRSYKTCPQCQGKRFNSDSLLYRLSCDELSRSSQNTESTEQDPPMNSRSLADFYALSVGDACNFIERIRSQRAFPAHSPLAICLDETVARLQYLVEAGLEYLTLDRPTRSLSGGETARVHLTSCLGTRLVQTLYVLDEPSVGLHPRDTDRLVRILQNLRDAGNTVVLVEHERSIMEAADQLIDIGPGHGEEGGRIQFQGTLTELLKASDSSLTAGYLSGARLIAISKQRPVIFSEPNSAPQIDSEHVDAPVSNSLGDAQVPYRIPAAVKTPASPLPTGSRRRSASPINVSEPQRETPCLSLSHVTLHNLRDVSVQIPLGRLVCVSGVSGSGKSTLIREVLFPLAKEQVSAQTAPVQSGGFLGKSRKASPQEDPVEAETDDTEPDDSAEVRLRAAAKLTGTESLGHVVCMDQSPVGRTPRSTPALYVGAFHALRQLFHERAFPEEIQSSPGLFSFNGNGQCPACRGSGHEKIEMQFLSDVFIRCEVCHGRRYQPLVLELSFRPPTQTEVKAWLKSSNGKLRGEKSSWSQPLRQLDPNFELFPKLRDNHPNAKSIADVLEATVDEAIRWLDLFEVYADHDLTQGNPPLRLPQFPFGKILLNAREARKRLQVLTDVGLGYLRLGQPINTLSGGECQRLKLAAQLAELVDEDFSLPTRRRPILFILDEPTTGLHFEDIRILMNALQRLVDHGHSVVIIEHHSDVIAAADWVIDLGPEGGAGGGRVVIAGTPDQIAACPESHTGRFLKHILPKNPSRS